MLKIKIDNIEVNVPEGISVMGAARMKGIDIPSMCYREGKPHFTSCMICMVKDNKNGRLFPSCSVKASEGMDITTRDPEIEESRKMALELLLSEHTGDCEAPCQITCPAHMDIPLMNRYLAEGKFAEALKVVKNDIALPAVFGRICPAPCEGACRRKSVDSAVSICLLKRYAGDKDLELEEPYMPEISAATGKKIAIIGAGPAGLAAAHYLQLRGHLCEIFDRKKRAGGSLLSEVENGKLEDEVLQKEIGQIINMGVRIHTGSQIDGPEYQRIKKEYDAVLIATGSGASGVESFGLKMTDKGVASDKQTYVTSKSGVFAVGSAVRPSKLAIRTLGQGKEAAFSIDQYLRGMEMTGEPFKFNSRFGKLLEGEIIEYLKEAPKGERIEPEKLSSGFTREQVMTEAGRCLHCDCRKVSNCKLRDLSDEYKADQKHYWSEDRKIVKKSVQHEFVIYESNKCIKCGICVHITEDHKEKYGMSFIGRGFDVVVGVPFNETLAEGLKEVAEEVTKQCPTGALAIR